MKHSFWIGFLKQAGAAEVACVAVLDGDKILLGKRKDNGKWTTPGGHMEPGETPVQGAVRELYEESGIKAKPEDLEHLATKHVTKPDGTKLVIHGFKFDEGKHKTTIKGDPDEEVHRWLWKSIPLPAEVAENLHVQKENVLLDALKIDYPQEKKASQLMDLFDSSPISQAIAKLSGDGKYLHGKRRDDPPHDKKASFYDAVATHMSHAESAAPAPKEDKPPQKDHEAVDKIPPQEKTEHEEAPDETKIARPIGEKLRRLRMRRGDAINLSNQFAQFMSQRDSSPHDHRGDHT